MTSTKRSNLAGSLLTTIVLIGCYKNVSAASPQQASDPSDASIHVSKELGPNELVIPGDGPEIVRQDSTGKVLARSRRVKINTFSLPTPDEIPGAMPSPIVSSSPASSPPVPRWLWNFAFDEPQKNANTKATLFDDTELDLNINWMQTEGDNSIYAGQVNGVPESDVVIIRNGDEITATIHDEHGRIFLIRPSPSSDYHIIEETASDAFPQDRDPRTAQDTPPLLQDNESKVQNLDTVTSPEKAPIDKQDDMSARPCSERILPADTQLIDVLIAYTKDIHDRLGGAERINQVANIAACQANRGYQFSGVQQRIRIAGIVPVAYREPSGDTFSVALEQITRANDGMMDEIHAVRDQYNADAVVLLVRNNQDCGLAWLNPIPTPESESKAFAVVNWSCAINNYSFAHELGHLQGADHNRENAKTFSPERYSYCFRDPQGRFRTIMAYDCPSGCRRINMWSNPDLKVKGISIGVSKGQPNAADNRSQLNETASIIAKWRPRRASAPSSQAGSHQ
jgi:hypothetical protein